MKLCLKSFLFKSGAGFACDSHFRDAKIASGQAMKFCDRRDMNEIYIRHLRCYRWEDTKNVGTYCFRARLFIGPLGQRERMWRRYFYDDPRVKNCRSLCRAHRESAIYERVITLSLYKLVGRLVFTTYRNKQFRESRLDRSDSRERNKRDLLGSAPIWIARFCHAIFSENRTCRRTTRNKNTFIAKLRILVRNFKLLG